jgi:hypothetical protein
LETLWKSEDPSYGKSAWNDYDTGSSEHVEEKIPADLPVLGEKWKWSRASALSEEERTATAEFLEAKHSHLKSVRDALEFPTIRASYDFSQGFQMLAPHLERLKREAKYFQIEALQAIDAQDSKRAVDAIRMISQLGNCLKDDPLLIGQLVRLAIYSIAISTTEKLLTWHHLDQEQLARLQSIVSGMDARAGLQLAYKAERTMTIDLCQNHLNEVFTSVITYIGKPPSGHWESAKASMVVSALTLSGLKEADLRLMADTYGQLIEIAGRPEYCATDALNASVNAASAKAQRFPPKILTRLLLPALGKAGEKFGRSEAQRRCILIAIEIEKLRRARPSSTASDWRDIIKSQPADLWKDPFTTNRLLFAETSKGYIIYSVGPDRVDNGGQVEGATSGTSVGATDAGFTVERTTQK